MTLACKTAPEERFLSSVREAGIEAVELFVSEKMLDDTDSLSETCRKFPLRYAVHANNGAFRMRELAAFTAGIGAEIVVFHDIYWESEWDEIADIFRGTGARLCVENTHSVHEPLKFRRRYGMGMCLDLEHLQLECNGVYEEEFVKVIGTAWHIHLTGYRPGTASWHTHVHHAGPYGKKMLDMIKRSGFSGMVVSEAKVSQQTVAEFKRLKAFYDGNAPKCKDS